LRPNGQNFVSDRPNKARDQIHEIQKPVFKCKSACGADQKSVSSDAFDRVLTIIIETEAVPAITVEYPAAVELACGRRSPLVCPRFDLVNSPLKSMLVSDPLL
jgi:hypothetical protein